MLKLITEMVRRGEEMKMDRNCTKDKVKLEMNFAYKM